MKYTTQENLENYLLTDIDPSFESQIEDWIEAISQYITSETGRVFVADTTASERHFDGNDTRFLPIDECISITKVEKGSDQWGDTQAEITSYIKLPQNYSAKSLPIDELMLKDGYWLQGAMNHTITAKWGYSASVPKDIELAATILTSGVIYESLSGEGEIKTESIGGYSVTYKDERQWADFERAKQIIGQYRKIIL